MFGRFDGLARSLSKKPLRLRKARILHFESARPLVIHTPAPVADQLQPQVRTYDLQAKSEFTGRPGCLSRALAQLAACLPSDPTTGLLTT